MFKKHWPLMLSVLVFGIITGSLYSSIAGQDHGHVVYTLDDAYIHMAMAKHVVQDGVWGVTRYGFSSSSSSLLWVLLLSLFYYFHISEVTPLVLNLVAAVALLVFAHIYLRKYNNNPWLNAFTLLAIVIFTPLPPLVFSGMEHLLQIVINLVFVYFYIHNLDGPDRDQKIPVTRAGLLGLAVLVTMVRFEGLFLILIACGLLAWRKRFGDALILGTAGLCPLLVYGWISLSRGWYFLPNSVLLKGNVPKLMNLDYVLTGYTQLVRNGHILVLVTAVLFLVIMHKLRHILNPALSLCIMFLGTTFLHMQFGKTRWFYRYEAYLVTLGILTLGLLVNNYFRQFMPERKSPQFIPLCISLIFLSLTLFGPLLVRGITAISQTPQASKNILDQQYQMGRFINRYYKETGIMVNDIGAVNFLSDNHVIDLWGLGSMETATALQSGDIEPLFLTNLAQIRDVKIALVYDSVLLKYGDIPEGWVKVQKWRIPDNINCASDTINFYAVAPREKNTLVKNLMDFSSSLPKEIVQVDTINHWKNP